MSEARELIADTVERLFAASLDAEAIARAEKDFWPAELWKATEEAGLTRALLDPEEGGAGGDWLDVFEIARAAGRHSLPLPLVETILAAWLLAGAGLDVPDGPLGLVPTPIDPGFTRPLRGIPWGRSARHLVGILATQSGARVACWESERIDAKECNVALDPRDTLSPHSGDVSVGTQETNLDAIRFYGALLRCGQMTGALERILDQSALYASERIQFGRPIGSFQVIQQELARLAGQVAEATMATEVAFGAANQANRESVGRIAATADPAFEIACAKVVVGEAAEIGPRIAHQIHGAIGFTYEHSLHFSTRRLWAWRAEFGTTEEWAEELGNAVQDEPTREIWPRLTER